ncbi:MAG: fumarylacetoacetate hydrolase family protein [Myxococcota bacterium]
MAAVRWQDGRTEPVGTVYAIGRNYAAHARELGNPVPQGDPVVFLKARAAVRGLEPAPLAFPDWTFHHEVELVLLVGEAVPLGAAGAWSQVAGVALGLDLTRRDVQSEAKQAGLPWTAAKSFAGSAVLGPFLPLAEVGDPEQLGLALDVNGERRQQGTLQDMLFDVPRLPATWRRSRRWSAATSCSRAPPRSARCGAATGSR